MLAEQMDIVARCQVQYVYWSYHGYYGCYGYHNYIIFIASLEGAALTDPYPL